MNKIYKRPSLLWGARTIWHQDNLTPRTIWHRPCWRTIWHQDNLTPDNLTPRTIWHRTIWHQDNLTPDNLTPGQFDTADNLTPCVKTDNLTPRTIWHHGNFFNNFFVSQPSAQRAHRHPLTVIYPPNVGRIYPIQIYIFNWHMFSPTQRPKGAQTPSNCHISPNCWQNISNTSIYIQLTPPPNAHASV